MKTMPALLNFIHGEFCSPLQGKWLENFSPYEDKVINQIPDSSAEDLEQATSSAQKAFPIWSQFDQAKRSHILMQIADQIQANAHELAELESLDTGKPITLAKSVDIPRAVSNLRFYAERAAQWQGSEAYLHPRDSWNLVQRSPLGVVAIISPWNLPLYLLTWKIAPALATGNVVIAKPSEITPLTAAKLCELIKKTDLPPGTLNMLHGTGSKIGELIITHPQIKAISFTGGSATGKYIYRRASESFKKVSLEMGGKNPALIFSDAPYEKMLPQVVRSSFSNQGQICLCTSRLYIEESLYDRFRKDFVAAASALKIGDPSKSETQFGCLTSKGHLEKVIAAVEEAKKLGGKILCGGASDGPFFPPTIIENLPSSATTNQKEIFGPVVTLIPFRQEKDLLQECNLNDYGLCASIWTSDLAKAMRCSEQLNVGMVWVNTWSKRDLRTPFGGTSLSGLGREGGDYSLRFFTEEKNICLENLS